MNYKHIYDNLISIAKIRDLPATIYTEKHHIVPRSFGGLDNKENIVSLSAREHFICHRLLVKIYEGDKCKYMKMLKAFIMMLCCHSTTHDRYVSSRDYQTLKENYSRLQSELMTGSGNHRLGTYWISEPLTGETKVIKGDLPDGWVLGRNKKYVKCPVCDKNYFGLNKTCGDSICYDTYMCIDRILVEKRKLKKESEKAYTYNNMCCKECSVSFRRKEFTTLCSKCSVKTEYFGKAVVDSDGVVYNSLTLAAKHYNITVEAIRYRIKIGKYKYLKDLEN